VPGLSRDLLLLDDSRQPGAAHIRVQTGRESLLNNHPFCALSSQCHPSSLRYVCSQELYFSFDDKPSVWNSCHCGHGIPRMKMVAPSLVRDVRDHVLLEIWRSSVQLLRLAKRWVITGYSFPPGRHRHSINAVASVSWSQRALRRSTSFSMERTSAVMIDSGFLFPDARILVGGMEKYIDQLSR